MSLSWQGDYRATKRWMDKMEAGSVADVLRSCGEKGIEALSAATPVRTGKTAASWGFEAKTSSKGVTLTWTNSNVVNGVPIAIILQYGHGTGTGGYVHGRDYINPAMRPVFDEIESRISRMLRG
nr:MAG TPA: type I neck protein [Caudoviricetes sp.]